MGFDIDIILFLVFLSINLFVGLRYGRSVKNIEQYALGDRRFSVAALTSTMIASMIGAGTFMLGLSMTYSEGLHQIIPTCFGALSIFLIGIIFVPRMGEFLGKISIAEAMGDLYGTKIRLITAFASIIIGIGAVAIQFKVMGTVLSNFLSIDLNLGIIIGASVVMIYSAFGGIKSVTYTDMFQFGVFTIIVPLIGIIIWINHDFANISNNIQNTVFDFKKMLTFDNPGFFDAVILSLFFFMGPALEPVFFQRISMGRNLFDVKKAYINSAIIYLAIILFIALIPFLLYQINPNIGANNLIYYIIDNYSYPGIKGLIIMAIFSMSMSTADSHLNISSVIFAHDIDNLINKKANELLIAKFASLAVGVIAIYLAMKAENLLTIILLSSSYYLPLICPPLILAVLGFRTSRVPVYIGMGAGFLMVISSQTKLINYGFDVIVPATFLNYACIFLFHFALRQEGGWGHIKDLKPLMAIRSARNYKIQEFKNYWKNFTYREYALSLLPKSDNLYSLLGIFCFVSTISTIYSTHGILKLIDSDIILYMYQSMLVISSGLMLYMMWSDRIRNPKIVSIFWSIALPYMLVFASIFFALISNFSNIQTAILTMNLAVFFMIVRTKPALVLFSIASFSSYYFYKCFFGDREIQIFTDNYHTMIYISLIIATFFISIVRPKEIFSEWQNYFTQDLYNQNQDHIASIVKLEIFKDEFIHKLQTESIDKFQELYEESIKLKDQISRGELKGDVASYLLQALSGKLSVGGKVLQDILYQIQNIMKLDLQKVDLKHFMHKSLIRIKETYNFKQDVKLLENGKFSEAVFDQELIYEVMKIIMHHALIECNTHQLDFIIHQDKLEYIPHFTDEYKETRPAIKIEFKSYFCTKTPFDQAKIVKIIKSHFGTVSITNNEDGGMDYIIIIPENCHSIRPKYLNGVKSLSDSKEVSEIKNAIRLEVSRNIAKSMFEYGLDLYSILHITKLNQNELNIIKEDKES